MMFVEIDKVRAELGLTAWELCRRAGVHPASYSQWRTGGRDPRQSSLKRLTSAIEELRQERREAAG